MEVTADIAGADVEGITGAALFIAGYPGCPDHPNWADNLQLARVEDFELVSGTRRTGCGARRSSSPVAPPTGTCSSSPTPDPGGVGPHHLHPDGRG